MGKSTLARLVATEYARNGWEVKVADMDAGQKTCADWNARRIAAGLEPSPSVEVFPNVARALKAAEPYHLLVFDGMPMATQLTLDIARAAHLLVLPTGTGLDDLLPTVRLAHELVKNGIPRQRIAVAFSRVGESAADLAAAREYIREAGYEQMENALPEKTSFRQAMDAGQTPAETKYPSLNAGASALVLEIATRAESLR